MRGTTATELEDAHKRGKHKHKPAFACHSCIKNRDSMSTMIRDRNEQGGPGTPVRVPEDPDLVRYTLEPSASAPLRSYANDVGWDLAVLEDTEIPIGALVEVSTGVRIALPSNVWGHLLPRSSCLHKYGVEVITGVIDPGYRGELYIQCLGTWDSAVWIPAKTRIAQLIPHRVLDLQWMEVIGLPESERGENGFGSTGV